MSFVRRVLSRKYFRFLMAVNAVFLFANMFGNYAALQSAKAQSMTANSMFDVQQSPPMIEQGEVAGVDDAKVTPTATPATAATAPPTKTPEEKKENKEPTKTEYRVAVFGDSMIDTMGDGLPYLEKELKKKYDKIDFLLYNYGMGAQNVQAGLDRFDKDYSYKTRKYPAIGSLDFDIIILGSFAYNPFDPFDRDQHWLTLSRLIEKAKNTGTDVYLLAEIAPLRSNFGKGPNGVNWDTVTAYEHSGKIIKQIENAIGLSKNLNVTLINAYADSKVEGKNEGKRELVNLSDGIHQSVKGQEYIAEKIAKTIILK